MRYRAALRPVSANVGGTKCALYSVAEAPTTHRPLRKSCIACTVVAAKTPVPESHPAPWSVSDPHSWRALAHTRRLPRFVGHSTRVKNKAEIRKHETTPSGQSFLDVEDIFGLMIESIGDYALFMLDPEGHVASWNKGAQRIKGYSRDEIIGKHFSQFYPEEDKARGKPAYELVVAEREGRFEDEGYRLRKDGTPFWANVVITAVRDKAGILVGFAKVTRDLTERRLAEERSLADARRIAEVETANATKSAFLTAMSHELRTPLNAIGGYTELLSLGLGGPVTAEQTEYLERIRRSQQHLMGIITDLLNFSKIEAGHLTYDIKPILIQEVLDTVVPMVEAQAAGKGVRLARGECGRSWAIAADRSKVDQILINVLSNAIKFTQSGGSVDVHCAIGPETGSISVIDTGRGIPASQFESIFEPFVQLGRSLSSAHEGTGLGLSISRDLARAMRGDLTVSSAIGSGSTFTLTLPLAQPAVAE
ncbi:MAG: PAS domain-containing sensor histidine kinase [Gemmatimonadaceae bacterium]